MAKICKVSFSRWHGTNNTANLNTYDSSWTLPHPNLGGYSGLLQGYNFNPGKEDNPAWAEFYSQAQSYHSNWADIFTLDDFPENGWGTGNYNNQNPYYPYSAFGENLLNVAFDGTTYYLQRRNNGVLVNITTNSSLMAILDYLEFLRVNGDSYWSGAVTNVRISSHII